MAAASDFMLNKVKVFNANDYPGYISTGRRNWNNSFITSSAMSHLFSLSEKLPCLQKDWVVFETNLSCLPSALGTRIEAIKNSPDKVLLYSVAKSIISDLGYVEQYIDDIIQDQCMSAAASGIVLESIGDNAADMIGKVMEIHRRKIIHSDQNPVAYHFASYHGYDTTEGILANFGYNLILVSDRSTPTLTQFKNVLERYCDLDVEISEQTFSFPIDHNNIEKHKICVRSAHYEKTIGISLHIKDIVFHQICMDEVISLLRKDFIDDKRMLWTSNTKAVRRMREAILQNTSYNPTLIYPTNFHHDISIWVHAFDESVKHDISTSRLATLVSLIADETFYSVDILEEYEKDGRMSKLFRITYRSLHHALSRHQCSELQLKVRSTIEQFFNVYSR